MKSATRMALLAAAALTITTAAHADLVLFNNGVGFGICTDNNCKSFQDLGGFGFGNFPRLLTLQTNGFEAGLDTPGAGGTGTVFPGVLTGNPSSPGITSAVNNGIQTGTDKGSTPNLQDLGWTSGANVGIGFVSDQTGQSELNLNNLVLGLYNKGTLVGTFALANPDLYTHDDLAEQPGNGNALFKFVLDPTEQAEWNALIALDVLSNFEIGLAASLGCAAPNCIGPANDGPESFVALAAPGSPLITPLPSAVWLFGTGLAGLMVLNRKRKRAI